MHTLVILRIYEMTSAWEKCIHPVVCFIYVRQLRHRLREVITIRRTTGPTTPPYGTKTTPVTPTVMVAFSFPVLSRKKVSTLSAAFRKLSNEKSDRK